MVSYQCLFFLHQINSRLILTVCLINQSIYVVPFGFRFLTSSFGLRTYFIPHKSSSVSFLHRLPVGVPVITTTFLNFSVSIISNFTICYNLRLVFHHAKIASKQLSDNSMQILINTLQIQV